MKRFLSLLATEFFSSQTSRTLGDTGWALEVPRVIGKIIKARSGVLMLPGRKEKLKGWGLGESKLCFRTQASSLRRAQ